MSAPQELRLDQETLLIIPCSGAKRSCAGVTTGQSILDQLTPDLAAELLAARTAIRQQAAIDELSLMPACRRYSGELYNYAASSIGAAIDAGHRILIVSGGYGVLLAEEPIGTYEKIFALRDWPRGLLERCLIEFAKRAGIRSVVAVMAASTDYAKVIRRVNWQSAGVHAVLVAPVGEGGGALKKVPRAQGQAIATLINDGLTNDWRSSDGFALQFTEL